MASRRRGPRDREMRPCALFPAHDHLDHTTQMTGTWHEDHCREASARPRTFADLSSFAFAARTQ